jgi:molecular chaperone GrpE
MTDERKKVKVPVVDKRGARTEDGDRVAHATPGVESRPDGGQVLMDESSGVEQIPISSPLTPQDEPADVDYLDALKRERASFANFRKRAELEKHAAESRGMARLIEDLLPVLDSFEAAIAHGEGVELMYKQFKNILESKGLEELPGVGAQFDPEIHHAIRVIESDDAAEEVVTEVHQRGYRLGERVLRAATVTVARPAEAGEGDGTA